MVLIAVATARQRLVTSFLAGLAVGAYIRRLQSGGRWHDCFNEIVSGFARMGGGLYGTRRGSAAASTFTVASSRFGKYYTFFSIAQRIGSGQVSGSFYFLLCSI